MINLFLIQAIKSGFVERVKLLIEHGADLEKLDDTYETRTKDKTPYQTAMLFGQSEIADLLVAAGAKKAQLSPEDSFQVACLAGQTERAEMILKNTPDLLTKVKQRDMLCDAATNGNMSALKTMIALGFDINSERNNTALHQAAFHGDVPMIQLLLDAGADPTIRDTGHFQTPLGFALYAENEEVIALLETVEMDIFTAAARGKAEKIEELLSENPLLLNQRFSEIRPGDEPCQGDWLTPLANAAFSNQVEAAQVLLEKGADTSIANNEGKLLHDLVREHSNKEVCSLIEKYLE